MALAATIAGGGRRDGLMQVAYVTLRSLVAAAMVAGTVACSGGSAAAPEPPVEQHEYEAGQSYLSDDGHVLYLAGNLPLVFSAPHGGERLPAEMPARTRDRCGPEMVTGIDRNTEELAHAIHAAFHERTGRYPHVVINRVHRSRLDANRAIGEAACGNPAAERAWRTYHGLLDGARARVVSDHGSGWYSDLHGHAHAVPRIELGYLLSASTLRLSDAQLDAHTGAELSSSIRTFSQRSPISFSALLRGPTSLGALLERAGYRSVPGESDPAPATGEEYFSGAYSTVRHGCASGGPVCGVQIEAHWDGVRNTAANRAAFATALVDAYLEYLAQFGIALAPVAN